MKVIRRIRFLRLPARPGFTLTELLVVLAVLVVLVTLTYAAARRMIASARIAESASNLRNLVVANESYRAEHGVYCPADDRFNRRRWHGARSSSAARFDPTQGFLSPYLGKSMRVTQCPLFSATRKGAASFEDGTGGYGYNAAYIGGLPGAPFDRASYLRISQRPANISNPARTVMFTTTAYARADSLQEYPYCEPPFWDYGAGPSGVRPSPTVHFRANGKALVAWCDGSVTAEPPNDSQGGVNPHGGQAASMELGWFGPEENNGWW
ncbi:MAG: prepilin-type N-terminal cleavage/methylation domain-containing protein, partial [Luteolibacter sp.]